HYHECQLNVAILARSRFPPLRPDVTRYLVVEGLLFRCQLVRYRLRVTRLEEWLVVPVHHLFLKPPQEEAIPISRNGPLALEGFRWLAVALNFLPHPRRDVLVFLEEIVVQEEQQPSKRVLPSTVRRGS